MIKGRSSLEKQEEKAKKANDKAKEQKRELPNNESLQHCQEK